MWEIAVHLAVACDVYDVSFCAVFFPRGVLDEILNLIESVSEGFPSYFFSMVPSFSLKPDLPSCNQRGKQSC